MSKYIFPAIFQKEGSMYNVVFPDIEGCYTCGESLQDAVDMAKDALCLTLYDMEEQGKQIPVPSDIKSIQCKENSFSSLVTCDTLEYRQFYDNKAIKKTLTIPNWLNKMSEKAGLNFSMILQNALKHELHIAE